LDKEGWLRPLRKCREASLAGADGVVGSSHRLSEVERTTPAAPPKERDHLLDGAATPPLPRSIQSCPAGQLHNRKQVGGRKTKNLSAYFLERGLRPSRRLSQTPVSSGRLVGNDQFAKEGCSLTRCDTLKSKCTHSLACCRSSPYTARIRVIIF